MGQEEGKKWEMKSVMGPEKISIHINDVSQLHTKFSFKACFLWFFIQFAFAISCHRCGINFEKLAKVGSVSPDLLFHPPSEGNQKFLHENAINKQMDRNNHRTENFALSEKKSQVSNFGENSRD